MFRNGPRLNITNSNSLTFLDDSMVDVDPPEDLKGEKRKFDLLSSGLRSNTSLLGSNSKRRKLLDVKDSIHNNSKRSHDTLSSGLRSDPSSLESDEPARKRRKISKIQMQKNNMSTQNDRK